jgi:hypothetical protein
MKMRFNLIAVLLILTSVATARTWHVGATRQYTVPSAVMSLVATGDTVEIDPGVYVKDVGAWNADSLVLRCSVGFAHLDAQGTAAQRKAIWVINGKHTYIEGIEFSGCAIDSIDGQNGAGIRLQGPGLEGRRCYFHDNQEGILTNHDSTSDVLLESCEFARNGVETGANAGFQHNIYIGSIRSFTTRFCYYHDAIIGHELKSRAHQNFIFYNFFFDGLSHPSYSINLPQGGFSILAGNIIEKGPNAENSTIMTYGDEWDTGPAYRNADSTFYFINNTVVTNRTPSTFCYIHKGATATFHNNIFTGPMHPPLAGFSDTVGNLFAADTSLFHFRDPQHFDYRLTTPLSFGDGHSPVDPGIIHGIALLPTQAYVHPMDSMAWNAAVPFFGAYRFLQEASIEQVAWHSVQMFPNPFSLMTSIDIPTPDATAEIRIIDVLGNETLRTVSIENGLAHFDRRDLRAGTYFYAIKAKDFRSSGKFVITP